MSLVDTGDRWVLTCVDRETATTTLDVDIVVNAAGAWGDVVAKRAGVVPLGLRPLRRTACVVPVSTDLARWPLVMDVAGRFYFEPETGGLLLSPADETPSEPVDATAEMEDVAWALEMLDEATTLDVRHVRSVLGRLAHVRPRSAAGGRLGPGRAAASAGWSAKVVRGSRRRRPSPRPSPRSSEAGRGPSSWSPSGSAARDLAPRRFR